MGWVDALHGRIVGLDTAPLIYFIEENPTYLKTVDPFFEAMARGDFTVVTSVITLLEVLIHPFRQGNDRLIDLYRGTLLGSENLTTLYISHEIAEEAARLRAAHNIQTPDSLQLATAAHYGASFFLTNDRRLPSLPGLDVLVLDEL